MTDPVTASIHLAASPERVFEYFTSSTAMTAWMGQWADLDPVLGGRFAVDIEGVAVRGRYLELDPPHRLLLSWGHAGSEHLPPGASTVEINLKPEANGTRVNIHHRNLPEPEASRHPAGWRRFLGQLAQLAQLDEPANGGDPRAAAPKPSRLISAPNMENALTNPGRRLTARSPNDLGSIDAASLLGAAGAGTDTATGSFMPGGSSALTTAREPGSARSWHGRGRGRPRQRSAIA